VLEELALIAIEGPDREVLQGSSGWTISLHGVGEATRSGRSWPIDVDIDLAWQWSM